MAYTSALFGLRVDSHPAYLALLERFAQGGYPSLGATLKEMGYRTAWVTSIAADLDQQEWQQYRAFYGVEHWLRHEDLDYSGRHYGWGPAPPDQFALSAANEALQRTGEPLLLAMITQNSHYPWLEVPELAADWRALDDGTERDPRRNLKVPRVTADPRNYLAAIRYELEFLSQFILEEADEEAIIVLIGDHQPGYITRRAEGFETPLYVISRDRRFLDALAEYGLTPGLSAPEPEAALRHEGFYSLLMRALLERYGSGERPPPPYLPQGAPLAINSESPSIPPAG
jgi:hypothetical protein